MRLRSSTAPMRNGENTWGNGSLIGLASLQIESHAEPVLDSGKHLGGEKPDPLGRLHPVQRRHLVAEHHAGLVDATSSRGERNGGGAASRSEEHTSELQSRG